MRTKAAIVIVQNDPHCGQSQRSDPNQPIWQRAECEHRARIVLDIENTQ